jgi:hypothetical protein
MEIVRNYKQGQIISAILRNTGTSWPRLQRLPKAY